MPFEGRLVFYAICSIVALVFVIRSSFRGVSGKPAKHVFLSFLTWSVIYLAYVLQLLEHKLDGDIPISILALVTLMALSAIVVLEFRRFWRGRSAEKT